MKKMKTSKSLLVLAFFLFSLAGIAQKAGDTTVIQNVDAKKFNEMLEKKDGILIDLRTPGEIEKGFIKGSVMIDYTDKSFEQEFAKLNKNKTTYIYCAGGGRSGDAAVYLKEHGFKKVVNLAKGFNDWKKQGMAVEVKK